MTEIKRTKVTHHLESIYQSVSKGVDAGLLNLSVQDEALHGRHIHIGGRKLVNFGSCSYLGLELDPRLKEGAIDAIRRYGTQFSTSRAYLSLGLYDELEDLLEQVYGVPALSPPTLTLGHQSNLPVLVGDDDAIILDHQVHNCVQSATLGLKVRGVHIEMIRHSRMDILETRIKALKDKYARIWYMADGVYSMHGDFAPMDDIIALLAEYEQLHLYVDDAHGASWRGERGAGYVRSKLESHERLYLTASMSKSFGTGGGIMTYPNAAERDKVRRCGGTMIFCGPMQPATIGAAIASLKIHLSEDLAPLQQQLRMRVDHFNREAVARGLSVHTVSDSPICFVLLGKPEKTYRVSQRLKARGYFSNLAVFPSVPYAQSGIRLTIHNHLAMEDIDALINIIAEEVDSYDREKSQPSNPMHLTAPN